MRSALSSLRSSDHSYVALAEAGARVDVAQRGQASAARRRDLTRQRDDAGLDNQLQLHQSESTIAAARQRALAAQQQIDALCNSLAALLGKGPDRGLDITRPRLPDAPSPGVPAETGSAPGRERGWQDV